jgi:hypothetical protein
MELGLRAYTPSDRDPWDSVVRSSRGPSFLLERNYLEYHADRFVDRSLVFTLDGELQALLPANVVGQTLWSHQGLTFGGLIVAERSRSSTTMAAFEALVHWMRSEGLKRLIYKPIPAIYHKVPCQEDLYALHRLNARLIRRDLSSTIDQEARLRYSKGRRAAVSRARREGVSVESSHDFLTFMELEEQVLQSRHGVRPVHTGAEMQMLAERLRREVAGSSPESSSTEPLASPTLSTSPRATRGGRRVRWTTCSIRSSTTSIGTCASSISASLPKTEVAA